MKSSISPLKKHSPHNTWSLVYITFQATGLHLRVYIKQSSNFAIRYVFTWLLWLRLKFWDKTKSLQGLSRKQLRRPRGKTKKESTLCGTAQEASAYCTKSEWAHTWLGWAGMTALLCMLKPQPEPELPEGAHVAKSWDSHVASHHCLGSVILKPTSVLQSAQDAIIITIQKKQIKLVSV